MLNPNFFRASSGKAAVIDWAYIPIPPSPRLKDKEALYAVKDHDARIFILFILFVDGMKYSYIDISVHV